MTTLREISLLKKFNHPNIVKLLGVFESKKGMAVIMEHMESELRHPFPDDAFRHVCQGVYYLHFNNVHGDIKPANIVVDSHRTCKLIDFGSASRSFVDEFYKDTHHTNMSTLWYQPPETLMETQKHERSGYMWSLGCVYAYIISGGSHLFMSKNKEDYKTLTSISIQENTLYKNSDTYSQRILVNLLNVSPKQRWSINLLVLDIVGKVCIEKNTCTERMGVSFSC